MWRRRGIGSDQVEVKVGNGIGRLVFLVALVDVDTGGEMLLHVGEVDEHPIHGKALRVEIDYSRHPRAFGQFGELEEPQGAEGRDKTDEAKRERPLIARQLFATGDERLGEGSLRPQPGCRPQGFTLFDLSALPIGKHSPPLPGLSLVFGPAIDKAGR